MNFRATSKFVPIDLVRVQAALVPRLVAAVTDGCLAVVTEARLICPVGETGALLNSIQKESVELVGTVVQGTVEATQPYAAFVEFGTGVRGAASPGAGAGSYSSSWPGMSARPYMRPALDTARPAIVEAFAANGFKV